MAPATTTLTKTELYRNGGEVRKALDRGDRLDVTYHDKPWLQVLPHYVVPSLEARVAELEQRTAELEAAVAERDAVIAERDAVIERFAGRAAQASGDGAAEEREAA
ncbi:hypothetical protein L3Q65_00560 (plasmid) [Amycolatopsis sp. FU40]|uniref:hypothetical protein n=1 Tax=Amycolatopsis sp. FU40 TaxID=2914159 RepID=UPI001F1C91D2|nr:hypothetical protein [Amycolatopsis sp. FU40]UKD50820.1 hypothetical protein L3Q65_00560 [Amycolatopsis sp. FU40]